MTRLYLSDAFGWDTETTAKVAIAELREITIYKHRCPEEMLIKNRSYRWQPNILKILGYLPVINVIAGFVAIAGSKNFTASGPNHTALWKGRGVAMIFGGPLLLVVDLIVHLYNLSIANKYSKDNPQLIQAFNTGHQHTEAYWPGHPVFCKSESKN
jgi:hypothetical protein